MSPGLFNPFPRLMRRKLGGRIGSLTTSATTVGGAFGSGTRESSDGSWPG